MKKNGLVIIFVLSVVSAFTYVTAGQRRELKADDLIAENDVSTTEFAFNDRLVLHAMRVIHSAQLTYGNTYGNGNFAYTLPPLAQAGLIDATLASGQKYGYQFSMTYRSATVTTMPGYELMATPMGRRVRNLSFYMNDSCDIRGGDKNGRDATITDPILEPCGTSLRTMNESAMIETLRSMHAAELSYQSNFGNGQFGTITQLYNAGLIPPFGFAFSNIWHGYTATLLLVPENGTTAASYSFRVVAQEYGRTGIRSFYMDQTGVLRGADKNGGAANQNDPPIND